MPSAVTENNVTLTKHKDIGNVCNKYFINISSSIQSTVKFSRNKFHDFLPDIEIDSFFINPVDKMKIKNIILSLNPLKLSNDVSNHLSELINLSFSHGVFPSILKSGKVIPTFKKESKLKCSNYLPIFLLSNIDKILEELRIIVYLNFWNPKI